MLDVDLATGSKRTIFEMPHEIRRFGVSEDGKKIMLLRLDSRDSFSPQGQDQLDEACTVEVRDYETGQLLRIAPFERVCLVRENGIKVVDALPLFGHGS